MILHPHCPTNGQMTNISRVAVFNYRLAATPNVSSFWLPVGHLPLAWCLRLKLHKIYNSYELDANPLVWSTSLKLSRSYTSVRSRLPQLEGNQSRQQSHSASQQYRHLQKVSFNSSLDLDEILPCRRDRAMIGLLRQGLENRKRCLLYAVYLHYNYFLTCL